MPTLADNVTKAANAYCSAKLRAYVVAPDTVARAERLAQSDVAGAELTQTIERVRGAVRLVNLVREYALTGKGEVPTDAHRIAQDLRQAVLRGALDERGLQAHLQRITGDLNGALNKAEKDLVRCAKAAQG
jgi:hypothetical protein